MEYRIERDSMGEILVPADRYWGAQTQRSHENFRIGGEIMPREITHAFGILKKAAAHVGEKAIEMIKSKNLLPTTGYIHGGCSPIGMKKQFVTTVDETAEICDTIVFSAGKIGTQVEMTLATLSSIIPLTTADLTVR